MLPCVYRNLNHSSLPSSCRQTKEVDRYQPLIKVYNRSLKGLKSLKVPGIREITQDETERVLFHLNDMPIDMELAKHLGKNDLKPDIVAVTLDRARQAHKTEGHTVTWGDFIFGAALQKPGQSFQWEWLLCSHEVEFTKGLLRGPPEHYAIVNSNAREQPYPEFALEARQEKPIIEALALPVPEPGTRSDPPRTPYLTPISPRCTYAYPPPPKVTISEWTQAKEHRGTRIGDQESTCQWVEEKEQRRELPTPRIGKQETTCRGTAQAT
jgi:hypothetical protein